MSGLSFETETEKENNHKKIFWIAAVFCIMLFISLVIIGISTFSISKMTADPTFEEKMYQLLTADGIAVEVEGSEYYAR